jgi:hypothetical protein
MNISIVSKTTTTTIGEIAIGRKKHPFIHPPMNFKTFLYEGDGGDMVC